MGRVQGWSKTTVSASLRFPTNETSPKLMRTDVSDWPEKRGGAEVVLRSCTLRHQPIHLIPWSCHRKSKKLLRSPKRTKVVLEVSRLMQLLRIDATAIKVRALWGFRTTSHHPATRLKRTGLRRIFEFHAIMALPSPP